MLIFNKEIGLAKSKEFDSKLPLRLFCNQVFKTKEAAPTTSL